LGVAGDLPDDDEDAVYAAAPEEPEEPVPDASEEDVPDASEEDLPEASEDAPAPAPDLAAARESVR